ncbi:hypothetical protein PQX77_002007 [Marasmius sp. AFHP31]|nr:hypothetical protein PQX77_002007 [Marasmius sp. AFHP31]
MEPVRDEHLAPITEATSTALECAKDPLATGDDNELEMQPVERLRRQLKQMEDEYEAKRKEFERRLDQAHSRMTTQEQALQDAQRQMGDVRRGQDFEALYKRLAADYQRLSASYKHQQGSLVKVCSDSLRTKQGDIGNIAPYLLNFTKTAMTEVLKISRLTTSHSIREGAGLIHQQLEGLNNLLHRAEAARGAATARSQGSQDSVMPIILAYARGDFPSLETYLNLARTYPLPVSSPRLASMQDYVLHPDGVDLRKRQADRVGGNDTRIRVTDPEARNGTSSPPNVPRKRHRSSDQVEGADGSL